MRKQRCRGPGKKKSVAPRRKLTVGPRFIYFYFYIFRSSLIRCDTNFSGATGLYHPQKEKPRVEHRPPSMYPVPHPDSHKSPQAAGPSKKVSQEHTTDV